MADSNAFASKMHFEVVLVGGPPWGFRIQGGTDTDQPVRVSKINPGSKAAKQGVQEGDLVESINGHSTAQLRNGEAHKLIRSAFDRLHISLRRERKKKGKSREDSDGAMYRTSTCIEINSPTTAGIPSTANGDGSLQSPHSTTLILNPIKTGIKQVGKERSREEVVVDAEDSKLECNVGENVNPSRQVHCPVHWNRCRRQIPRPSWHFISSTVPSTTNRALRIDKKITRLQQACCDVWDILTDEGTKKIRRLPSMSSTTSCHTQRPLAMVPQQYSFSAPILPPPPGFRDMDNSNGDRNGNRYSYPPATARMGAGGGSVATVSVDVISPADEFRDLSQEQYANIRPWESADGAELVYDSLECVQSDSEEADDVNGSQGFLRPNQKPRKALSEGSWPIFFAQSDSEGWLSSGEAQLRTSTGIDDTKQQLQSVEMNVCSYTKNIPTAANFPGAIKHSAIYGITEPAAFMDKSAISNYIKNRNKVTQDNAFDAHPEVDSVWKRKIQRFANTVQLSVNSSSTPGSSSSSPCLSIDDLEEGASACPVPTIKIPILSGLVRAEMEQRAAAQRKLLEKTLASKKNVTGGSMESSQNPMSGQFVRMTSHGVPPSDESDEDDDKECDDVFIESNVYHPITSDVKHSDRSSSEDLSPVNATGRLVATRESRGSSTSHSESVATVIERTLSGPSSRLLIRSSASTLSSMDSDSSIGGAGGGCSASGGVIGESIEELEDEQIESTSGSSGTSGGSVGTAWQVTDEGCFYLPEVGAESGGGENKLADKTIITENKTADEHKKPVVVIEVTEDGTRRVISGDDYDTLITNSPVVNKIKIVKDKDGGPSLSDHSGTENGDTTSQSSLETVMTVLEKKRVKPPVPPKPQLANLRKTPPITPVKPLKTSLAMAAAAASSPPVKVHETGGYVLLSLHSFSQDDEEEIVQIQPEKPPIAQPHVNTGTPSATNSFESKFASEASKLVQNSGGSGMRLKVVETREESCVTEQRLSDDSYELSNEDDDEYDSKTLTPETAQVSNSDLDTTASSFSCPRYYSVHASTQTELVAGPGNAKKKVRRRHTITNPIPSKPVTTSQSTMTSSLQTDMEESGGTLDDLPSIVSDEVGAEEHDENAIVIRGDSPLLLRKTDSFHSMSSSGSSSALGGSSDGLCGGSGGNFQTPDHTLTDISDIPSHYTNLDLDCVQVTIPDAADQQEQQQQSSMNILLATPTIDDNRLNSPSITPSTTPSTLLSPSSPSKITSSSSYAYEELGTGGSKELSDLQMKEFDSLNFSEKEHSHSHSEDDSKTLCQSPRPSGSSLPVEKVEGSSTSDVDTDETLGKGDHSDQEKKMQETFMPDNSGEMLLTTTNESFENRPRSTSPILLTVEDSSRDDRRTPSLTIVRSGSGNSGSSGGSPLLEFEVEVLVDELFRDFSKTVEDACRSGGKSPTPPSSRSISDAKLSPANSLEVVSRCSSASPKPPSSPVKRTKLFSISMVQRSRDSTSPSRESNDGQRLTVKGHHQQRHSFDLTLATSSNTNEFLSASNISTSKRYHSLELPTQTTIEIPQDRTPSPLNNNSKNNSVELEGESLALTTTSTTISTTTTSVVIETPKIEEKKESSPRKSIVYQPIVHEPVLAELMNRASRKGSKAKEIGWQRIESIPSELYYITTVEDVSEDFGTCIITTPLEPTSVTILDDPSKSEKKAEKKSERPALVSTKSGEKRAKAEGPAAPCPSFKATGGKAGVWSPGSSPASTPPTQIKAAIFRENTQESTDKSSSTVTLTPVWKPSSPGRSPDINKPEFKSVKLEASPTSHKTITKAQENGNGVNNVYPPPASFANSSSTAAAAPVSEERGNVSRGERNPPAIPPKTLSLKRSTSGDTNQPIYANVNVSLESSPPAFTRINPSGSGLPPSQNPTVTLLQKAREGRIPAKEAVYIDHKMNSREDYQPYSQFSNNENVGKNRWINDQFVVKSEEYLDDRKVTHLEPVKFDGIGPTIRGVPVSLCTGVKDENKAEWYKRMYKSLHRATEPEEEYEVVKYRKRGRPYLGRGGYVSEPEPERIEQYGGRRYGTLDRRKHRNEYYMYEFGNGNVPKKQPNVWNPPSARYSSDIYKNQPKRIEDYEPGHSSIAEMEAKMDDNSDQQGNRQNDVPLYRPPPQERPFFIKDGYESDSTLVYHKRGPPDSLSPAEQRAWYLEFQKGGDIPLAGFRRPAPDRPEEPFAGEPYSIKCMTSPLKSNIRSGKYQWWPPNSSCVDFRHSFYSSQGLPLPSSESLPNISNCDNLLTPPPSPNTSPAPFEREFEIKPLRPHLPQCFSQLDHETRLDSNLNKEESNRGLVESSTAEIQSPRVDRKSIRWWNQNRFSASLPRIDDIDDNVLPSRNIEKLDLSSASDLSSLSQAEVTDDHEYKLKHRLVVPNLVVCPATPPVPFTSDNSDEEEEIEEIESMEQSSSNNSAEYNEDPEVVHLFSMASSAASLSCLSVLDQVLKTMKMTKIGNDILREQPFNVFQPYTDRNKPTQVEILDVTCNSESESFIKKTTNKNVTIVSKDFESIKEVTEIENEIETDGNIVEPPEMFSYANNPDKVLTEEQVAELYIDENNVENKSVGEKIAIFEAIEEKVNDNSRILSMRNETRNFCGFEIVHEDNEEEDSLSVHDCDNNILEEEIEEEPYNELINEEEEPYNELINEEEEPYDELINEEEKLKADVENVTLELSMTVNPESKRDAKSHVRFQGLDLIDCHSFIDENESDNLRSPTNKERLAAAAIEAFDGESNRCMSPERQYVRHMLSRSLDTLTNKTPASNQLDKAAYVEYLMSFMRAPHLTERFNRLRGYYGTLAKIASVENIARRSRSLPLQCESVPELKHLYDKLDAAQRSREFLYKAEGTRERDRCRWTQNCDRFLSYRCQSVYDLRRTWMEYEESERIKMKKVSKSKGTPPARKLKENWEQMTSPTTPTSELVRWSKPDHLCRSVSVSDLVEKFNKTDEICKKNKFVKAKKINIWSKPWSKYSTIEACWQKKVAQKGEINNIRPSALPRTKAKSPTLEDLNLSNADSTWPPRRSMRIHEINPDCSFGIVQFEAQPPVAKSRELKQNYEPDIEIKNKNDHSSPLNGYSGYEDNHKKDLSLSPPLLVRAKSSSNSEGSLHEMDGNKFSNNRRNLIASGNGKKQDIFISRYFSPGYVPLRTQSSWELSNGVLMSPPFNYIPNGVESDSPEKLFKSTGNLAKTTGTGNDENTKLEKKEIFENTVTNGNYDESIFKRGDVKKLASKFDNETQILTHPQNSNSHSTGWSYIIGSNLNSPHRVTPESELHSVDKDRYRTAIPHSQTDDGISYQPVGKSLQRLIRTYEADKIVRWLFGDHEKIAYNTLNCSSDFVTGHRSNNVSRLKRHYEHVPRIEQYQQQYRHHVSNKNWRNAQVKSQNDRNWINQSPDNQFWVVPGPSKSSPNLLVDFESTDQPVLDYSNSTPDCLDTLSDSSYSPQYGWMSGFAVHDRNNNTSQRKVRMPDIRLFSPRKYDRSPTNFRRMCQSEENLKSKTTTTTFDRLENNESSTAYNTGTWPSAFRSSSADVTGTVKAGIARYDNLESNRSYTYSPLITSTPTLSPKHVSPELHRNSPDKFRHWEPLRSNRNPSPPPPRRQSSSRRMPNQKAWANLQTTVDETSMELDRVEFGFPLPPPKVPLVNPDPPHRYHDSEVNIHYRSPVRNAEKDYVSDEEIRRKQEWMMKQFYEEERRKKTLQEMADIENRRHTDNFVPSQKSPIPLDRYDNLYEDTSISPVRLRTPEPKTAGKALHSFRALTARELSFNKGDIIIINRKIDKNWYEGEHHGHIGIFPVNHVEIIPYDSVRITTKKASEGQGRVKYNFQAQTNLELSLVKGETVILTRKVDRNWYEGRVGSIKGIFPASYIDVLIEPGKQESQVSKPVASPVSHSLIKNGNSHVSPKPLSEPAYNQSNYYNQTSSGNYVDSSRRYGSTNKSAADRLFDNRKMPLDQTLHIQTQNEPIRYRAIYNYKPQNDDELELRDGDTVYVMEKCDDGWFVGSSQRTGLFGTFPGNYVERICKSNIAKDS